jgi:hypothetical protein
VSGVAGTFKKVILDIYASKSKFIIINDTNEPHAIDSEDLIKHDFSIGHIVATYLLGSIKLKDPNFKINQIDLGVQDNFIVTNQTGDLIVIDRVEAEY